MVEEKKFNRKCVGCNQIFKKKSLIRVVKSKEAEVRVDFSGKLGGRGAYICNSTDCLRAAIKNKGLERSLKCKIPKELIERLTKEIEDGR